MKKLFALMLCIVLTLSLVACGGEEAKTPETTTAPTTEAPTTEAPTTEEPSETEEPTSEEEFVDPFAPTELTRLLDSLYEGYNEELPMLGTRTLTAEEYEYIVFTPYVEGMEAAISEPMMGSIAHAVVALTVPEGTDVETVRASIEANADPRRWICVEAEQVNVVASGNTILFVMSSAALADTVVNNFNAKMAG